MTRRRNSAQTTTTTAPLGRGFNGWVAAAGIAAGVLFAALASGGAWERFGILLLFGWVLIGLCISRPVMILVLAAGAVVFVTMLAGPFREPTLATSDSIGPAWARAVVSEGQRQYNERVTTPPTLPAIPTTTVPAEATPGQAAAR